MGSMLTFAELGGTGAKIEVGISGDNVVGPPGVETVFVTVQKKGGEVQCYDTTGASCGVVDARVPDGVGTASAAFQFTRVSESPDEPTTQTLSPGVQTDWVITTAGNSITLCQDFVDPRKYTMNTPDLLLCDPNGTNPADCPTPSGAFEKVDLGLPILLPSYVRGFQLGTQELINGEPEIDVSGPPVIRVCLNETAAEFLGFIEDHISAEKTDESPTWLGYTLHPFCPEDGMTAGNPDMTVPRVYFSTLEGEPSNVEDLALPQGLHQAIDVTVGCNHPLGGSWRRSATFPGVWVEFSEPGNEFDLFDFDIAKLTSVETLLDEASLTCEPLGTGPDLPNPGETFLPGESGLVEEEWRSIDLVNGEFGSEGNGFLIEDNVTKITITGNEAAWDHKFFILGATDPIIPSSIAAEVDDVFFSSPTFSPYVFCFENLVTDDPLYLGAWACSDGSSNNVGVGIRVLQNKANPTTFALLFDDGGAGPDEDFSDLVVTAEGPATTACGLRAWLSLAFEALENQDVETAVGALLEIKTIIEEDTSTFPEDDPFTTELLGRLFSILFDLGEPQLDGHQ
jgi:hypothetical protein